MGSAISVAKMMISVLPMIALAIPPPAETYGFLVMKLQLSALAPCLATS